MQERWISCNLEGSSTCFCKSLTFKFIAVKGLYFSWNQRRFSRAPRISNLRAGDRAGG